MVGIKVKRLSTGDEAIPLPEYKTKGASGMDIYAMEDQVVHSDSLSVFACGFSMEIPYGYEGHIRDRSGVARSGLKVFGGTIDSDYRGEVHVMLYNFSRSVITILAGDRIAQMVINKVYRAVLEEVEDLSDTSRGLGGFGHTGR